MSSLQKSHQNNPAKAVNKPAKTDHKKAAAINPAQIFQAPETMSSEDVLGAQKQFGNQVVQRALDKGNHGEEAADPNGNLRKDIAQQIQQKRGSGSPLPGNIQREVGKKLGRNFSDVRVHTDSKADKLSRSISARAFTIGSDIFFKEGVFEPGTSQGRETLMHELTHVVQQSGNKGGSAQMKLGAPDTAMEKEAEKVSKNKPAAKPNANAHTGKAVQRQPDAGGTIQRLPEFLEKLKKKKAPVIPQAPDMPKKDTTPTIGTRRVAPTPVKSQSLGGSLDDVRSKLRKTDTSGVEKAEKARAQSTHDTYKKESDKHNTNNSREALMAKLKDPSTSTEEAKLAQQKLDVLHKRGKMDTLKAKLTRGKDGRSYSEQAMKARKKNLKAAAKGGDDNAFKSMMAEKEERKKNSTGAKIKGALGGLLGLAGEKVKEQGVKLGTEYKDHFLGKPPEKEGGHEGSGGAHGGTVHDSSGGAHGGHEGGGTAHDSGGGAHGGHEGGGTAHDSGGHEGAGNGDVYKKVYELQTENESLKKQLKAQSGNHGTSTGGSHKVEGHGSTGHTTDSSGGGSSHGGDLHTESEGGGTTTHTTGHTTDSSGGGSSHGGDSHTETESGGTTTHTSGHQEGGSGGGHKESTVGSPTPTPVHHGTDSNGGSPTPQTDQHEGSGTSGVTPTQPTRQTTPWKRGVSLSSDPSRAHELMKKKANAQEGGEYRSPEAAHRAMVQKANAKDAPELRDPQKAHETMLKQTRSKDEVQKHLKDAMAKRRALLTGDVPEKDEPEESLFPERDESEWD